MMDKKRNGPPAWKWEEGFVDTKEEHIRGYLLNVFDFDSADVVKENIVFPLKEAFQKEHFDSEFSVPVNSFSGYMRKNKNGSV